MNLGEYKEQETDTRVPDYDAVDWRMRVETDAEPVPGCIEEFGPHMEHGECGIILANMNPEPFYYPDHDYTDPMGYNSDSYMNYLNADR